MTIHQCFACNAVLTYLSRVCFLSHTAAVTNLCIAIVALQLSDAITPQWQLSQAKLLHTPHFGQQLSALWLAYMLVTDPAARQILLASFLTCWLAGSPRNARGKSEASNISVCHAIQLHQVVLGGDIPGFAPAF